MEPACRVLNSCWASSQPAEKLIRDTHGSNTATGHRSPGALAMRVSAVSRCALSRSATMGNQLGSGINRGDNSLAATGSWIRARKRPVLKHASRSEREAA